MSNKSHFFRQSINKSLVFYDRFNNANINEIDSLTATSSISYQIRNNGTTGIFNGSTFVQYPSEDYFNFSNKPFSIGGYFKSTNIGSTQMIVIKRDLGSNDEFQLALVSSKLDLILFDDINGGNIRVNSNVLNSNLDYSFCITYDGSGSELGLNIYINGVLNVSQRIKTGAYVSVKETSSPVIFGRRPNGSLSFIGNVDSLFIFNYVIDSLQIADINTKVLNNNDIR